MTDQADRLADLAAAARTLQAAADRAAAARPGHPGPLAVSVQADRLAVAARWFIREPPTTQHYAAPLVRARLRTLTDALDRLETTA